jgi:hypothetical protein
MDSRLNLAMLESREADLARRASESRVARRWPDDGRPPRLTGRPRRALHPAVVVASMLTGR